MIVPAMLFAIALVTGPSDHCAMMGSPSLRDSVARSFPGYRFPTSGDNLAEDVEYSLKHNGTGCLGVAAGDFDGDGKPDYVIGLTRTRGDSALIIAAIDRPSGWVFERLGAWPKGRSTLYVAVDRPGRYVRSAAFDEPPTARDEVSSLTCKNDVAVFGKSEANGIAFCRRGKWWQYVWISD
jgi:hypothetical protein